MSDSKELRDSVRDYRNPRTSDQDCADIKAAWHEQGIPNQFAALLRAAEIERGKGTDEHQLLPARPRQRGPPAQRVPRVRARHGIAYTAVMEWAGPDAVRAVLNAATKASMGCDSSEPRSAARASGSSSRTWAPMSMRSD